MSYLQIGTQLAKDNAYYAAEIAKQKSREAGIDQYTPDTQYIGNTLYSTGTYAKDTASATASEFTQSYNDGTLGTKASESAGKAYSMFSTFGSSLISQVQNYASTVPGGGAGLAEPNEPVIIIEENKNQIDSS